MVETKGFCFLLAMLMLLNDFKMLEREKADRYPTKCIGIRNIKYTFLPSKNKYMTIGLFGLF